VANSDKPELREFEGFFKFLMCNTSLDGEGLDFVLKRGFKTNMIDILKLSYLDKKNYQYINQKALQEFGIEKLAHLRLLGKDNGNVNHPHQIKDYGVGGSHPTN
jgi:hypothetical protein